MNRVLSSVDLGKKAANLSAAAFVVLEDVFVTDSWKEDEDEIKTLSDCRDEAYSERISSMNELKARIDRERNKLDSELCDFDGATKIWIRRSRIWAIGSRRPSNHCERSSAS
jgi:uncharacterized protein